MSDKSKSFEEQKKVLVSLERELHIPELREKLENYINTVDEKYRRLNILKQERKALKETIEEQRNIYESVDVPFKYPKGQGNAQLRKEYLETLMNNDSAVVNARAQLEITEADIEELQAEIDLIEADISVAYHLDELNHARFKFIASNNMGSYESTRRKLLEIEAYYKVDEVAMGIRRHMDEIMPDKEKLWGLQKKLSALIKNNADNKVKDDLNDEIEELKKRIALKNKQLAMLKRTLLWHASRISLLANCTYTSTISR